MTAYIIANMALGALVVFGAAIALSRPKPSAPGFGSQMLNIAIYVALMCWGAWLLAKV